MLFPKDITCGILIDSIVIELIPTKNKHTNNLKKQQ